MMMMLIMVMSVVMVMVLNKCISIVHLWSVEQFVMKMGFMVGIVMFVVEP